jgi:2-polyprenyl-3-methyl-5-hydroxy-6-metoxy-1,4-benzoquinol methylase
MSFSCPGCSAGEALEVDSYKHTWPVCVRCGTVSRVRKARYPLDRQPFRFLFRRTRLKRIFARPLLPDAAVVQDEKNFYDYYHSTARTGEAGTKWESSNDQVMANLDRLGIAVGGQRIIDISGGPGFLTQRLARTARQAVVTEFSQHAVDGMTHALGIDGVKFDYNHDRLPAVVDGRFDVVLIIYSLGFCADLRGFVRDLREVLAAGAVVYLAHCPPSLGLMMRWQFDDYTYVRSWPAAIVAEAFAAHGLREVARESEGSYPYDHAWFQHGRTATRALNQIIRGIGRSFARRAERIERLPNKELVQHNLRQVFRLD